MDTKTIDQAAGEILGRPFLEAVRHRGKTAMAAAGIAMLFAAALIYYLKPDFPFPIRLLAVDAQKQTILRPLPPPLENETTGREKQIEEVKQVEHAGQADGDKADGQSETTRQVERPEQILQTVGSPPPATGERRWGH